MDAGTAADTAGFLFDEPGRVRRERPVQLATLREE
jgi:hypothetical protein